MTELIETTVTADVATATATAVAVQAGPAVLAELAAAVWSDVLAVDPPAADADFFELGGHSLAAVKILSRIEAEYDVELPVILLFEYPVFAEFVEAVREALADLEEVA
ncbi:hypothetical protein KGQ20_05070 [Catenulispora sp. NF23]|uniref:phosphopantetheine-binding protein n=1 Tax=Catenulispora pinistramenti TaxID=2705254 RepID=UPI001BA4E181|nr:phosphopantetheine-binding protein [Catenulispora pinistramenti]MBS2532137.1 hypothetical protein [Catenulispora pinistramenti]